MPSFSATRLRRAFAQPWLERAAASPFSTEGEAEFDPRGVREHQKRAPPRAASRRTTGLLAWPLMASPLERPIISRLPPEVNPSPQPEDRKI
jgi:hypothetical protein